MSHVTTNNNIMIYSTCVIEEVSSDGYCDPLIMIHWLVKLKIIMC